MNIERKWMVLKLDTDGVTIVESHKEKSSAGLSAILLSSVTGIEYSLKYGYPWEA